MPVSSFSTGSGPQGEAGDVGSRGHQAQGAEADQEEPCGHPSEEIHAGDGENGLPADGECEALDLGRMDLVAGRRHSIDVAPLVGLARVPGPQGRRPPIILVTPGRRSLVGVLSPSAGSARGVTVLRTTCPRRESVSGPPRARAEPRRK